MSLSIIWTKQANAQVANVYDYIWRENPSAAEGQLQLIGSAVENLADFPELGRAGRREGTRELVIAGTPYIVVYRIRLASVRVLAVMHGAQRWPRKFR